ncbi:MAG TPA: Gfo/Idh/MocA family oxidoreductase [Vicinamibacterales bacterium]|jgi:predicted dehydrogenase|nr:Gfo/Idh/MocA family oxidoreductase [Vicinamibacterales bacterium]
MDRRDFLKLGGTAVAAGALGSSASADATAATRASGEAAGDTALAAPPIENVRIGYVGIGGQGSGHVSNLLKIPGCRITAVCDIRPERTDWATKQITAAGHPAPVAYTRGPQDFVRLCETEQLDLVYNATPWEFHVPIMLAAMKNGKHTATEVPAAMTVEDCWAIVEAAEKDRKHCVLMENCNYDRMEMMVYNMVRKGVLGEILHAEGGYLHDLRSIKFADEGEGLWRRAWDSKVNGNTYPTHGLGPVANCLDINRGDRFDYLVSMSGPSRGLQNWAADHVPVGSPKRQERYVEGDINCSLIKTANGKTILVEHCTNLPRPYSRIHTVQGTKGLFQGYPNRVYIEGRGKEDAWTNADDMLNEFEHPLWKEIAAQAQGAGHGGMDFIEDYRLIKCLREGTPTDFNVYDAAAISAVVGLSMQSVAKKSAVAEFPDFTRGAWKTAAPVPIFHM